MEKRIGKITQAKFGLGGYQDAQIGIHFLFESKGWGVSHSVCSFDYNLIPHTEHCKWTEQERSEEYNKIVRKASDLLKDAKVDSFDKLIGIPVEVTFVDHIIKDWRILTEVI